MGRNGRNYVTAILVNSVTAMPDGAGSCAAGIGAIETNTADNIHIQYAGFPGSTETRQGNSGTLFEGATVVTLNGEPLIPNTSTTVRVGEDLVWEVTAKQVAFKGISVRVETDSNDFTNVGTGAQLKDNDLCYLFNGVMGVTHVSDTPKTVSTGTINFRSSGSATMDITVVYDNYAMSIYAFNSFQFTIEQDEAPTVVPAPFVPAPAVPVPTVLPTPYYFTTATPTTDDVTELPTEFPTFFLPPSEQTLEPTNGEGNVGGGMGMGMGMDGGMGMGMDGGMGKDDGGMGMGSGMGKDDGGMGMGMDSGMGKDDGGMGMGMDGGMGTDGGMGMNGDDDEYDDDE